MKLLYIMNGIYIVFIIFILFILYNYLYIYEESFESTSYTSSINNLLTGNKWINPQTFDKDVTINGNLILPKGLNSDLIIKSDKKICIDDTCVTKEELQLMKDIISGNKNIYIYKQNNGNDYLYSRDGYQVYTGKNNDPDSQKKERGSWRISTVIPKEQYTCTNYSTNCSF